MDVIASHYLGVEHDWVLIYDAFSVCRNCNGSSVFILKLTEYHSRGSILEHGIINIEESLNNNFKVEGFRCLKDVQSRLAPKNLPDDIKLAFEEGATCIAVNCYNGGATMFRLCIDHATRSLLPETDDNGLNRKIRRSLGLRMKWLFDNALLPESLKQLSTCIREDGNDGAHSGNLYREDAEDILDFTYVLLERLYTEPDRIRQAEERRSSRRITSN